MFIYVFCLPFSTCPKMNTTLCPGVFPTWFTLSLFSILASNHKKNNQWLVTGSHPLQGCGIQLASQPSRSPFYQACFALGNIRQIKWFFQEVNSMNGWTGTSGGKVHLQSFPSKELLWLLSHLLRRQLVLSLLMGR